jgi:acyl transferase domain-containing protein/acyl carrier protein
LTTGAPVARSLSHPLLAGRLSSPYPEFTTEICGEDLAFLSDHRLDDSILVPAAVYLEMLQAAGEQVFEESSAVVENLMISQSLRLGEADTASLRLSLRPTSPGEFSWELHGALREETLETEAWTLLASGGLRAQSSSLTDPDLRPIETGSDGEYQELSGDEFYQALSRRGIDFGPRFQGVQAVRRVPGEALAEVSLPASLDGEADAYLMHPALLDACLHSIGALLPEGREDPNRPIVLTGLQRFEIRRGIPTKLRVYSSLRPDPDGPDGLFTGESVVRAEDGKLWAHVEGLQLRSVDRAALAGEARDPGTDWHYRVAWERTEPVSTPEPIAEHLAAPNELATTVGPRIASLAADHGMEKYAVALPGLERYAVTSIRQAVVDLGWHAGVAAIPVDDLAEQLRIQPRHRRFFQRLVDILVQEEEVERDENGVRLVVAGDQPGVADEWDSLAKAFPECEAELEMTARCGRGLPGVLRGELDPLELLFPEDDPVLIGKLYRESPALRAVNAAVKEVVGQALDGVPDGSRLRVLEVGAGTGGTTAHLLAELPAERTTYTFSDLSNQFLAAAQRRFTEFPFVEYRVLDIESDPEQQGFAGEEFDVVLASNVVHATADLRRSLENLKRLVAPRGLLFLVEGTRPQHWIDLVFGMTDGWWRFEDRDLRPSHPLVKAEQWVDLLRQTGFEAAESLPAAGDESLQGQAVLVARAPGAETTEGPGRWLIFADRSGVGASLAADLESSGASCSLVSAGNTYRFSADEGIQVRPEDLSDFVRLIADLRLGDEARLGIVHLWSLDACAVEDTTTETLRRDAERGCGSVLHLVRALADSPAAESRLWLVTRRAQTVEPEPGSPIQTTLWGLGRVVALEHPELRTRLVDLPTAGSAPEMAATLRTEIFSRSAEDQVAYRAGERSVARLVRTAMPESRPLAVRAEASYLITGGLGGLGLLVARWLVEQGARHLVLMGRRGLPGGEGEEVAGVDPDAARRLAGVRSLEELGATVRVVSADVGDGPRMTSLFERFGESEPPLAGVIHVAGVVDFRPLIGMDLEQMQASLRPKVAGAWILHELTRDLDLDFFAMFSSTTALWGSAHLAHYAAANLFLGGLANYRQSLGLPATTIDWGLWEQAGDSEADGYRRFGLRPMPAARALAKLGDLLAAGVVQEAVADVDWNALKAAYEVRGNRPLLEKVGSRLRRSSGEEPVAKSDDLESIRSAAPEDRLELLSSLVTRDVAKVLGLDPERDLDDERGFFEVGMDSLTAMELKRRLEGRIGGQLPDTLTFNYPTVGKLSRRIYQIVFGEDWEEGGATKLESREAIQPEAQKDDRSEEELLSLLANKVRKSP